MKKKLLFAVLIVLGISIVYTITNQDTAIEKLRKKHANFLKEHPYNKTLALTKSERKTQGLPPNKYYEQEYLLEMNPNTGRTHPENYRALQKELNANRFSQRVPGDASDNAWVERGPNNVGGRTRVVLFDPNDGTNKRVFAGGVSGGLWVNNDITDATSSWTRVGIDENLSVSCITVDPNNTQIMYLGTGESYTGDDGVGNGVWKSTDGGATWVNIFSDDFNADISERIYYINDIIAWNNPTTSKTEIFLGIGGGFYGEGAQNIGFNRTGLYKSIDDGATFVRNLISTTDATPSPFEPNDFIITSDNTIWFGTTRNRFGDGGGTIFKSTDGATFTNTHTIVNADRLQIAASGTDKDKIYVLASRFRAGLSPVIQVTTDGFVTITNITTPADADTGIPNTDFTRGQAWFDLAIAVDPTDDAKVYVGGIDLFRSTDTGGSWKQISKWHNTSLVFSDANLPIPTIHADQHTIVLHPTDGNVAVIGNDGGIFYASSLSAAETTLSAISSRNKEYNITQFYNGAIGQSTSNELLLAGAQDNGTPFINGAAAGTNASVDIFGGDGAHSFIDKDSEYMIVSYVYNYKGRADLPFTGTVTTFDTDQDTGDFINAQELDDNLDILYANASHKDGSFDSIVRYTDLKSGQTLVKKRLGNVLLTDPTTALKVSPFTTTSTTLLIGTQEAKLLKITDANTASPVWSEISGVNFSGSVSSIAFGANENEIIVTFHNYGVKSIWYTEDGGTTWNNKEGDFPDIPVKAVMMSPLNSDEVIIGTQLGVWRTSNFKDASPKWIQSSNGMSNVKVTSFSLRTADNTVLASTYGRGMFTGTFPSGTVVSVDEVIQGKKVFTMYPTVSDGNFTVFAKNTLGKTTFKIFDINGRQVHAQKLDFNIESKQSISVQLSAGLYIVNLIDANNIRVTGKIIIK